MSNLPIQFQDKENSPALLAYLQQFGEKSYLSAEEINQIRDAINELAQGSLPDAVLKTGTISITGLAVNIAANAYAWRINQQSFLNPPSYGVNLTAAANGFYRADIIVGTSTGTYQVVQGNPSATTAIEPNTPEGTIRLAGVVVFGMVVGQPTPTPMTNFIQKSERSNVVLTGSGVINQLNLVDEKATIVFKDSITRLNTISYASVPYNGKRITLFNAQATPVTIGHSVSGYGVDFVFPDGQDYVLKPNETIEFSFDITYAPYAHHMVIGSKAITNWSELQGKPSTFPPSAHTHTKSQITDFAHTHPISDVTGLPTALGDLQLNKEDKANKNIANGYAGLDSSGKINPIQLPALAITETFVVGSESAMLSLVAEVGDVAVRTDLNKSFILRVTGASTLANWQELLFPTSVDQTIIDGSTNAVSGNAVFDALATKAPISSVHNPVTLGTANGLSLSNQQLSLGLASSDVTGALSGTDWNTFNNKVNGTGTNNFLTKWSGTNTVNASGAWRETSNRLSNATDNGSSEFQVTGRIDLKSKNTQGDGGQLGAELLTTGTGDASWTGTSFSTGYTHVAGSATTLTSTLAPAINTLYQVAYTVTGRTAGSFTIAFGGTTTSGITATGAVGHRTSTTGTLVITPTSDFNGTIILSIKQITAVTASFVFRDNSGTIRSELRILGVNNTASGVYALQNNTTGWGNTASGVSALQNNTTGGSNTASGVYALQNNTTGGGNTASGVNALLNNTTGVNNTASGVSSLQNNTTGGGNTASGVSALQNNTTGGGNTASGLNAGRFIANGTTPLTVANRSTFLGTDTKALSDNSTNETVIGNSAVGDGNNTVSIGNTSVVSSRLRGRLLQGNVVDNSIDSGQFGGNVLATGFRTASGTASQFLKANGSVDSNTYLTSASLPTVDQTIIDGSTNAVSGNAVFDGLATKFNTPTGLTTNYLPKWNGSGFVDSSIDSSFGVTRISSTTDVVPLSIISNQLEATIGFKSNSSANNYSVRLGAEGEDFMFKTLNTERMRIKSNGRVLINKTNDDLTNQLQVNGTISASPATLPNQVVVKSQLDAVAGTSGSYTPSNQTTAAQTVNFIRSYWEKNGNVLTVTTSLTYTVTQIQSTSSFPITLPNGFLVSGASNGRIIGSSLLHTTQGLFNNNANMKAYETSDSSKINLQANFQAPVSSGTYETTIIYTVLIQ